MRNHPHRLVLAGSAARIASSLAALALASTAAHAAPTVWNVNVGNDSINTANQITTTDNFVGAAVENTANSTWNAVSSTATSTLADSTGNSGAAVTFTITPAAGSAIDFGQANQATGAEIFTTWIKDNGNNDRFTITFGNLTPSDTYALVIYSDWVWGPNGVPVEQTAGSGLTGIFFINSPAGNPNAPLLEDTNPANVASGNSNYARFNGLTADGSNNLTFSMGGVDGPINGFQLVKIDLGDTTAPTPDPMTWATPPVATSPYSITMTATTASDASGVEYQFTETSNNPGGTSSEWQTSPTYTDTDLVPDTTYTYTVTARDLSPAKNETQASSAESATTNPADIIPPSPSPMTWQTAPVATGEASITMTATTATDPNGVEYQFTETSNNPGGDDSEWQTSPVYTDTGLQPGTTYTYTVTARDLSPAQNETQPSSAESATTAPADTTPPPTPGFDSGPVAVSSTRITMTATTVSDVNGVEYYFTETSGNLGGSDSGWQDSPVYTDGGLTPNVTYSYTVKARDKSLAGNTSGESLPASATTAAEGASTFVWNVNIGNQITTDDNFLGAAAENTTNSFWNSVTTANPTGFALADSAGSGSAGVTLTLTGPTSFGDFAPITGPEIFSTWIKSSDNATPYTMTIGGLSFSRTYDLIVYSDWNWKGDGTLPLTQTLGSGLTGTVVLDQISTGTNGIVPGLVEDTDPQPNTNIEGNWLRITGLTPDQNGNLGFSMGGTNAAFSGFQLVQSSSLLARITSFGIPGATGVINQAAKTISLTVPFGTDLATLAPDFTLTPGSTCNQTSGAPPAPTFAVSSTANYVVTDPSTDPDTVNSYAVTVTVGPEIGTLVIDLGNSPGTTIIGGEVIGSGPTNLPLPSLPIGSILRSIAVNVTLQATDNDNYANELSLLFGPSQGTYTLGLVPAGTNVNFAPAETLNWAPGLGADGVGTSLVTTSTDADWLATIDLGAVGLFLGNAFTSGTPGAGGTWSGTITLTYDIPGGSAYATWATGNQPFNGDANGDGVTDGMAFLLGAATPAENAIGRLPKAESNGGLVLRFNCRDAASRGASTLKVQWSNDLGANDLWTSHEATVPPPPGNTVNGVVFVVTENLLDPSIDEVQATIPSGQAAGGKLFARLLGLEN
jgi:hypothetical protein